MTQRTFFSRAVLLAFLLLSPGAVLQAQELEWAVSAGSATIRADSSGIATDPDGNSYVTGFLFGSGTFGAGEANEMVFEGRPPFTVFVAKYGPDGTLLWATSAWAHSSEGIATDPSGNAYVTGRFGGGPRPSGRAKLTRRCLKGPTCS